MTNRQMLFYGRILNDIDGYEINIDVSTNELEIWRVKPYEDTINIKFIVTEGS